MASEATTDRGGVGVNGRVLSCADRHAQQLFELEAWASKRLGVDLFAGVTDARLRRERFAARIMELGLSDQVAKRTAGGRDLTWAQLYQRAYCQPLPRVDVGQAPDVASPPDDRADAHAP